MIGERKTKWQLALEDQRGSMLVVGIPMALFLTAVTWHLLGVCDAALLAEYLRFSADKTAFESAIWHSRGMNVVAMLNVLMTALSAVWLSWNILSSSIGFVGVLCSTPGASYCSGHTQAEADKIVTQMNSGNGAVLKWIGAQAIAVSDLQKATSSVTPTIALYQTKVTGTGPMSSWLEYSVSFSTALVPDDNIDGLTGHAISAKYPRLGVATRLPALPLESEPPQTYCTNVPDLVPDVSEQIATRIGAHWALDVLTATGTDWRTTFKNTAIASPCLGFAKNVDAAGIWYPAEHSSKQYHQYAFAVWGLAFGKSDRAKGLDTGVQVGAAKPPGGFSPPDVWTVSQSEYYYDCGGQPWSKCQDTALMNPGWTARLRRVRKPPSQVKGLFNYLALPAGFTASLPGNVQSVLSSGDAVWNRLQKLVH